MYTFSYDKTNALLVGLFTKQAAGPADFDRHLEAACRLDDDAFAAGRAPACVSVLDPTYPAPDATARKRLAAAWGSFRSPAFAKAVVVTSAEHRGAMTALTWILPPAAARALTTHDDFEGAVRRLEALRGRSLGRLHALFHETRALVPPSRSALRVARAV